MPVSLAGFVKQRRHQFGRQSSFGTAVAAKRAYAFKGVPSVDPQWTDPDVDTGSIDPVVAPYRAEGEFTAPLTCPVLHYNDLPLMLSGFFGGNVAATGGTAKTRLYAPASTTVDPEDPMTYEFGDDVVTDWLQMRDGKLTSLEFTAEGKGPVAAAMQWLFAAVRGSGFTDYPDSPTVPTDLAIEPNEAVVYGKDIALYIASDPYDLNYSGAKVADALHRFTLRLTVEVDKKNFLDGDQSFDLDAIATASRLIELECTFAKTPDIVGLGSESDAWFSKSAVDRYVRLYAESEEDADVGVPNSWDQSFPLRYRTRTESEVGGNSVVVLTGQHFYAANHNIGAYSAELVNTLPDAEL